MKTPRIEHLKGLRLAGMKRTMSLAKNETVKLWQGFMPIKNKLKGLSGTELYSVEIYPEDYFVLFSPAKEFEKWAAVPVGDSFQPNDTIQLLEIPEGLYAVFSYQGKSSRVHEAYQYIFEEWMPESGYQADHRPHFAVMGDRYRNDDPDSEEALWVPVKNKEL